MSSDAKLDLVRPEFRRILEPILDQLEAEGWQPKCSNTLRTPAEQLEKVRLGYAMPGATDPGSHGWGCAADVIDRRYGWRVCGEAARFFARLVDLASEAGLTCGGTWWGKGGTRLKPTHKSPWSKWGLGWDPAHVAWESAPAELRKPWTPPEEPA